MPIYQYSCANCNADFELLRPMVECDKDGKCPECGLMSRRVFSSEYHVHWGWILTEASHHKGATDTWVQDKPSNESIVYREKAIIPKTVF